MSIDNNYRGNGFKLSENQINGLVREARNKLKSACYLGIKPFDISCDSIVKNVSSEIVDSMSSVPFVTTVNSIHDGSNIDKALSSLSVYDSSVKNNVESCLRNYVVNDSLSDHEFRTRVEFSCKMDSTNNSVNVDKESGKVITLSKPSKSTILDPIWFAHEGIHASKEVFYKEYADAFTYADVIPIFHEFLTANSMGTNIQQQWLAARFYLLNSGCFEMNVLNEECLRYPKFQAELKFLSNLEGAYLVDYYYAVLLFQMYKRDRTKVINGVNQVLTGKITTKDLLDGLGILEKNSSNLKTFSKENAKNLQKVKSYSIKHK